MPGEQDSGVPSQKMALAAAYGHHLLKDSSYARLSVHDLRTYAVLKPEQTLPQLVLERIAFDRSILPEAWDILLKRLPPPLDTPESTGLKPEGLISGADESDIRKAHLLRQGSSAMEKIKAQAPLREFTQMVIDRIGQIEDPDDPSADPKELEDFSLRERLVNAEPFVDYNFNNEPHFALNRPRDRQGSGAIMAMFPGTNEDLFVVADPVKNAELTTFILKNPDLLRFYLAKQLGLVQDHYVQQLNQEVSGAAIRKSLEMDLEVGQINFKAQAHFIDLLTKAARTHNGVTLTEVFRAREDEAAFKGKAKPVEDRRGVEGGHRTYGVSSIKDGSVDFFWRDEDYRTRQFTEKKVRVRINRETGTIKYTEIDPGDNGGEKETPYYEGKPSGGPASEIAGIIGAIEPLSKEDRYDHGLKGVREAKEFSDRLAETTNLVEFIGLLRYTKNFPKRELIVNQGQGFNIKVGITAPQGIQGDGSKNS